jgi:hypothetical protein
MLSLEKISNLLKKFSKVFWKLKKIQYFPSDLAYPMGGSPNEFKYFRLEIHYNNPQSLQGS